MQATKHAETVHTQTTQRLRQGKLFPAQEGPYLFSSTQQHLPAAFLSFEVSQKKHLSFRMQALYR